MVKKAFKRLAGQINIRASYHEVHEEHEEGIQD
jgi:hypothetical protein